MAPISSEEEISSLLFNFDQIHDDFKNGVLELKEVKSSHNDEVRKREALQNSCTALKLENERLVKLNMESLNKLYVQLERRVKCQALEEQLKRVNDECHLKEDEHRNAMQHLTQNHAAEVANLRTQISQFGQNHSAEVGNLRNQIRSLSCQAEANEETIQHLSEDPAVHKGHIQVLTNRLEHICSDVESKYHYDIQDLKDCLAMEQQEKNELNKKVQNLEKELVMSRTRVGDQQRDFNSNKNIEMLKEKIMRLRKENEVLKRRINGL